MKRWIFLFCALSLISCVQAKKQATPKTAPKPLSPLVDSKGNLIVQPEEIAQVVRTNMPNIQGCYNATIAKNPNAEGWVHMTWVISPEGKLLKNEVSKDTMPDPSLGECMKKLSSTWTFPPPAAYRNISVTYPFLFKKAKK